MNEQPDSRDPSAITPEIDPAVHEALDGDRVDVDGGHVARQVATLGAMQDWLRATRPAAPHDLAARVSRRLEAEAARAARRAERSGVSAPSWHAWLRRTLVWQPAHTLALAAALALVLALQAGQLTRAPHGVAPGRAPDSAGAVGVQDLVAHRFEVDAPNASQVCLVGNFNGWSVCDTPLERTPDGRWSATVQLPQGRYEYMFVIDSEWRSDPRADLVIDDGFGNQNAVILL